MARVIVVVCCIAVFCMPAISLTPIEHFGPSPCAGFSIDSPEPYPVSCQVVDEDNPIGGFVGDGWSTVSLLFFQTALFLTGVPF